MIIYLKLGVQMHLLLQVAFLILWIFQARQEVAHPFAEL
ncbi:hypothetical protein J830_4101, partial [Acinetobacter baumannii 25691_7]